MPIPRFVLGFEKASADRHRPCENKRHGETSCSSQASVCRYALRETTTDTISLLSSFYAVLFHWYCMLVLLLRVWMDFLIFYHASIPPAPYCLKSELAYSYLIWYTFRKMPYCKKKTDSDHAQAVCFMGGARTAPSGAEAHLLPRSSSSNGTVRQCRRMTEDI